jgi:hypothetical protein
MRHGLISKGASACYDIEGEDMISNIHINFNRMQICHYATEIPSNENRSPMETPNIARRRVVRAPKTPRSGKEQTICKTGSDEDLPCRPYRGRRRPRTIHDSYYKLKKRKKKQTKEE